ncbi:MAG TPA: hypothetical protein VG937_07415 [Polyangiaceae bacterium]|nr:hypothetical protein [Polyangiaceae bacterium]
MEKRAQYAIGLFASFSALAFGCSAESGSPTGGTGGTNTVTTGGTTSVSTGGTNSVSTGGTPSLSTGGTTATTGGSMTTVTGGTATTTTGGTSTTTTGGTSTTTTGGTSTTTTGGTSTTTTGGTSTTTTGGTATAGASATGGSGGAAVGCSDGCAELKVPFTAYKSAQAFEIYLPAPVDFSAGVVTVKLRTTAGKAGGIQVVLKNPEANKFAWAQTAWLGITDTVKADWTTVTLDAAAPPSMDATNVFDKTQVSIIAVQIAAGDPWYSDMAMTMVDQTALVNPTTVQIDEITVAGATAGPWKFTANATDLHVGSYMPVTGATATWLPPAG